MNWGLELGLRFKVWVEVEVGLGWVVVGVRVLGLRLGLWLGEGGWY